MVCSLARIRRGSADTLIAVSRVVAVDPGNPHRGLAFHRPEIAAVADTRQPIDGSSELVLSGRVRLLDADPELGARLDGEQLDRARKYAMLPAVHLEQGRWDIQQLRDARGVRGDVYGFVLNEGTITIDATSRPVGPLACSPPTS